MSAALPCAAHVEGEDCLIDLTPTSAAAMTPAASSLNHRRWHLKGLRDIDDPAGRSHYVQSRQIETTDRLFEA